MKLLKLSSIVLIVVSLQCCSVKKNKVFWVSGVKSECSAGAGKMKCLKVTESNDLDNPEWKSFYDNISGFYFEEGYLKKIEVKQEKVKHPPADGSMYKYTFVKELDKKKDNMVDLPGNWVLTSIYSRAISRNMPVPKLTIDLNTETITGNGGCNTYNARISSLSFNKIDFGPIMSTKRACFNKTIEQDYFTALNNVYTYQVKDGNLVFYDEKNISILSFIKSEEVSSSKSIQDSWIAVRINGNPINRMATVPTLKVNLENMQISGNDGCNNFNGVIKNMDTSQILLGNVASTSKMCREMDTPSAFKKALIKAKKYKHEDYELILYDENGEEILAFKMAN